MTTGFPWKLFKRIVAVQAALVLLALLASGLAARYFFERQFTAQVEGQLRITLGALERDLPAAPAEGWCKAHSPDSSFRLTVIRPDGVVICDSHHDAATMENHADRPEVAAALANGDGKSTRFSATLGEGMLYAAFRVPASGLVLRGAIPLGLLAGSLHVLDTSLAISLVGMALVLGALAVWLGRRLAFPIGRLLLKARRVAGSGGEEREAPAVPGDEAYGELSELESSLDRIRLDLETKAENLTREREEHATLMRAISDAILAVDLHGAPLFSNARFSDLFGKGADLRHAKLWELFRNPEVLGTYRSAFHGEAAGLAVSFAEDERFFSLSVSPLRRPSGETYGAVGVFHDVTELKRAEQVRIDFVANVSHELRTPLTSIKGYTDTLASDLERGEAASRDFVEIIRRNTERLMSLVRDLLDLSSLESNAEDLQRSPLDTAEITQRVLKQLEAAARAKEQRVEVTAKARTVLADPRRLEQVLVNLLDNASKYSPAGARIRVSWEGADGGALLRVADQGPGIPFEHQGRLFERFYRVDKARSRELGGTGLGLAIVKHILQRHGGRVWVESEPGKGATFSCFFPG